MNGDIKAPRRKKGDKRPADTRTHVAKLTLTAGSELDEMKLSIIAYAMFPLDKPDKQFQEWMRDRLCALCKELNVVPVVSNPAQPAESEQR